jgi:hypothetical protein
MSHSGTLNEHGHRAYALFITACLVVAALLILFHDYQQEAKWPVVSGAIQRTRVVPDHSVETKWGSELWWKAEYRVGYTVGNREYAVWAESGIRGESEANVQLLLPQSRLSCRVQYNPKMPEKGRVAQP